MTPPILSAYFITVFSAKNFRDTTLKKMYLDPNIHSALQDVKHPADNCLAPEKCTLVLWSQPIWTITNGIYCWLDFGNSPVYRYNLPMRSHCNCMIIVVFLFCLPDDLTMLTWCNLETLHVTIARRTPIVKSTLPPATRRRWPLITWSVSCLLK